MFWADGSIYRGLWDKGVQSGLGLMIFKDGVRKAGIFENNIYKSPLLKMEDFDRLVHGHKTPESFKQEIKEYIGL